MPTHYHPPEKPEDYRRRAEEARKRAATMSEPEAQRLMLETAATWERVAEWRENNPY